MTTLANSEPRVVRAVAHVHSQWSDDASWPLPRIAATFARLRCRVVLMSEHSRGFTEAKWQDYRRACAEASTEQITLVPGVEYGDQDDVVHVPVWGDLPFLGDGQPAGKLLAAVSEAGGTAMWAHPWRRDAWQRFEPSWASHLAAVEVWNRKYDGIAPSQDSVALARREGLAMTVALDFHTRRQIFPLSLALDLDASPSISTVERALRAGRFSARAFGLPMTSCFTGPVATTLRALERARQARPRR